WYGFNYFNYFRKLCTGHVRLPPLSSDLQSALLSRQNARAAGRLLIAAAGFGQTVVVLMQVLRRSAGSSRAQPRDFKAKRSRARVCDGLGRRGPRLAWPV
ncbi:MAG TPA: hypothetical protein VMF50_04205, partial [Candidatus Binataceae bacterium]|nr:hypothetical protein [Candidatus Binataceae bacterium]